MSLEKQCTKCNETFDLAFFNKNKNTKDGLTYWCKKCTKQYFDEHKEEINIKKREYYQDNINDERKRSKEKYKNTLLNDQDYNKKKYQKNKEKISERSKIYRKNNPEKVREQKKNWRKNNPDKFKEERKRYNERKKIQKEIEKANIPIEIIEEQKRLKEEKKVFQKEIKKQKAKNYYQKNKVEIIKKYKEYYKNNPDKKKEQEKKRGQRRKQDPNYQIKCNLRQRLNRVLKNNSKSDSTFNLIGCTIQELKQHLEIKFQPGMTWENYGKGGWEIDHIRPCASFDLSDPEQQRVCFHYTNLQPLWGPDNWAKRDLLDWAM